MTDFYESTRKQSDIFFVQADATKLPFLGNTFDIVLDKGTIDSIMKMKNKTECKHTAKTIMLGALNVVRPPGVYVQVTDEDPELRMALLEDLLSLYKTDRYRVSYKILSQARHQQEYFMYIISRCTHE